MEDCWWRILVEGTLERRSSFSFRKASNSLMSSSVKPSMGTFEKSGTGIRPSYISIARTLDNHARGEVSNETARSCASCAWLNWKVSETVCCPRHYGVAMACVALGIMGWLRLVGSFKLQVSFAEYSLFYRALLQKRHIILRSLLIVATPYALLHPGWRIRNIQIYHEM